MTDRQGRSTLAEMSAREREHRSRIKQLIGDAGLLRGNLLVRQRLCGKPTCRCVRGERHISLVLQVSLDGRPRQILIPKAMEAEVRLWVEQHQQLRERLEKISRIYLKKIENAKKRR